MPTSFWTPAWTKPDRAPVPMAKVELRESVDLVVVGAGLQGLSTALEAAKLGLSVRVLEQGELGAGASGVNGGQVIPGLKQDPEWLLEHFGPEQGERVVSFVSSTADHVFDLIERYQLAAQPVREGWVMACHTFQSLQRAGQRHRDWSARGADVALLNAAEVALLTGASGYVGGWLDRRAGTVNPLALTLEIARVAVETDRVRIATGETVAQLRRAQAGWEVSTASGATISAKRVLVATNAASGPLVRGLAASLVPLNSFQIATEPLTAAQSEVILPHLQAVSDSRRIVVYYRKSPDGRLVFGGRGRLGHPRGAGDWRHIERAMVRLFPILSGVRIDARWFGTVAMTPDHLPHVHVPEDGLFMLSGCQGRGVALMTAAGVPLARYAATGDPATLPFPVTPIRPIPLHGLRQAALGGIIAWYRLRDRFER